MGFFGLGELPKEYNRKIHGPYDPATYYGKSELKLKFSTPRVICKIKLRFLDLLVVNVNRNLIKQYLKYLRIK